MTPDLTGIETRPSRRSLHQRRRSERRGCDLMITVRAAGAEYAARLLDLSEGGAGLGIATLIPFRPGATIRLAGAPLGDVRCVIRWAIHPRYGVEFQGGPQTLERVRALYDSLPAPTGENA